MGGRIKSEKRLGITAEMVRRAFSYDSESGILLWANPLSNRCKRGDIATTECRGRLSTGFSGVRFETSHIIWLIHYGEWPTVEVDHKDRVPSNIRIKNLRLASSSQNCMNQGTRKTNKLGIKGVCKHPQQRGYLAQIMAGGYRYDLGVYPEPWMAAAAYRIAASAMHGDFMGV